MPAPFINFSNIAPVKMEGLADFFMNQKKAKASDLANAFNELRNQEEPHRFKSQMENELKQRQHIDSAMDTEALGRLGARQNIEQSGQMFPGKLDTQRISNEQLRQNVLADQIRNKYREGHEQNKDYMERALNTQKREELREQRPKFLQEEQMRTNDIMKGKLVNDIFKARAKYADKTELAQLNKLLGSNKHDEIINKYLPKSEQAKLYGMYGRNEAQRLSNQYYPEDKKSQIEARNQSTIGQAISNLYAPEKNQAQIKLTNKQIEQMDNPAKLQGLSGAAHDAYSLQQLEDQFGPDSKVVQDARAKYDSDIRRSQAWANSSESRALSRPYTSMPAADKERSIAYAAGMGYDPAKASQLLAGGNTLEQMAEQKGVNLADVEPVYNLSKGARDKNTQRGAFISEIDQLEKDTRQGIKDMGYKVLGYSATQLGLAMRGKDANKQAEILAARALMPELASLRGKAMGANMGIQTLHEIQDKSLGNLRIFESVVSPKVRDLALQKVNDKIRRAYSAYDKHLRGSEKLGRSGTSGQPQVLNFDPRTGGFVNATG